MNKILCVFVLLGVAVATTSARSHMSLKALAVYKKELSHRYASSGQLLWQLAAKRGASNGRGCEVVKPCFTTFWTDIKELYDNSGSLQQCSDIVDNVVQCIDAKLKDGSICSSCNKEQQIVVVHAMLGVSTFKDAVCAGFVSENKDCSTEELDCIGQCMKEQFGGEDEGKCLKCVDDLSGALKSNLKKCPPLRFLKPMEMVSGIIWPALEASFSGCPMEDMDTCFAESNDTDCSREAVREKQKKTVGCLKKLARENSNCESLSKIVDMFKRNADVLMILKQQDCNARDKVAKTCGDKKKRLLELLRRFLEE